MSWIATAIVGSAVIGGVLQSRAAGKAADAQTQASELATEEERRQFDINRRDLAPYREAGTAALTKLSDLMKLTPGSQGFTVDDFWNDPVTQIGFQSGLDEGTKAIDRMAGASGMRHSGATLKALTRFGQDYAGQRANDVYDRLYNRLAGISGTGQTAATNTAALGSASAGRISDLITGAGNARGAAAIARGNAWGQGFNTVGNWFGQNAMLDKIFRPGGNPARVDTGAY